MRVIFCHNFEKGLPLGCCLFFFHRVFDVAMAAVLLHAPLPKFGLFDLMFFDTSSFSKYVLLVYL